ncbi:MAG TPA: amidohydrolase family protein [Pyrinomonadaceae bacterium]|nr:amidohydrolase family protein [Pyrinomonadaceae bacterium]
MPKIYTARWVLPIVAAAINDGAIVINDSKIAAVGDRAAILRDFPGALVEDFGNAAILPGLINAHSHLELTVMRGFLEREEHDFFAWLRKLTIARLQMTDEDLFVSAACGAIEAARAGITCLGDSSSFAVQSMRALSEVGLRAIVYQESFGPDPKLAGKNVDKLREQLDGMRALQTDLVRAGVSPHAPYTVSARQLEMISRLAVDEAIPVMMHAAESAGEQQLMLNGIGPFADGLRARGIDWQAPGTSTVRYLSDHGVLETKPLLAHCINVDEDDLQLIRDHNAGVAHCPKSNAKLGHGRAPFAQFIAHGLNLGLGSDSVASNNTSDILEEARFATLLGRSSGAGSATDEQPGVSATQALLAATLGGARALGLSDRIGALKEGMQADIAVVSLDSIRQQPVRDPADALIFSSSGRDVLVTVVGGREVYRNGQMTTTSEEGLKTQLDQIRAKLDSSA